MRTTITVAGALHRPREKPAEPFDSTASSPTASTAAIERICQSLRPGGREVAPGVDRHPSLRPDLPVDAPRGHAVGEELPAGEQREQAQGKRIEGLPIHGSSIHEDGLAGRKNGLRHIIRSKLKHPDVGEARAEAVSEATCN